mgnify:CR=1 FL=1
MDADGLDEDQLAQAGKHVAAAIAAVPPLGRGGADEAGEPAATLSETVRDDQHAGKRIEQRIERQNIAAEEATDQAHRLRTVPVAAEHQRLEALGLRRVEDRGIERRSEAGLAREHVWLALWKDDDTACGQPHRLVRAVEQSRPADAVRDHVVIYHVLRVRHDKCLELAGRRCLRDPWRASLDVELRWSESSRQRLADFKWTPCRG